MKHESLHSCEKKVHHPLQTYKKFQHQKCCQIFKPKFYFSYNTHHWWLGDWNPVEALLHYWHAVTVLKKASGLSYQ